MNSHLIAIVGGSGSGKSWLAQHLAEQFGEDAGRLSLDDFYRDLSHLRPEERDATNFDHPSAIDWPLFHRVTSRISRGQATALPSYDFATHTRRATARGWQPRRLVLIEGLWLLRYTDLRRLYSMSVFVECPAHVRLERRLERDQRERGRTAQSVQAQFDQQVAPMHERFVTRQARHADFLLESPVTHTRLAELRACCNQRLYQAPVSQMPPSALRIPHCQI